MFDFKKDQNGIRRGKIETPHGDIVTPAFLPDATYGSVKMLSFQDVLSVGITQILCTTLHLHLRPGDEQIKALGGLHKFLSWEKPILTDSGGWQVFSLIHQTGKGKVTSKGATFYMPNTGQKAVLTPEKSIQIQKNLGSDIILVLDDPIIGSKSKKENAKAVRITIEWAKRAKIEFLKQFNLTEDEFNDPKNHPRPLLFSIVQGGNYKDLRKKCAEKLIQIGFDGYGYGGILIRKDPKTNEMLKYFADIVPEDKIRYGMGVGYPKDIAFCIEHGYDLFDSVVPTRNGRHGQAFTSSGKLNLNNSQFKNDSSPIDKNCNCLACKNYSRAYIHHLLKVKEVTGMRLVSMHNLSIYKKFF